MSRPSGAEVVVPAVADVGEGPVWNDMEGVLLWVDILAGRVHRFDPATEQDAYVDIGQPVGALVPRARGGLALAVRDGFAVLDPGGALELVAAVEENVASNRMNDGKCDAAGRFWAGTTDERHARAGAGSLYRLDPSFKVTRMLRGVTLSNGIDWSPDGSTMYHIDTPTHGVDAYDFDSSTGEILNWRRIIDIEPGHGSPDGMTVDADGYLWVAMWGGWGLRRYSPSGSLDGSIPMPVSRITSCAFGGPGLKDLYVTSARRGLSRHELGQQPLSGSLFRLRPGVQGLPAHTFGG